MMVSMLPISISLPLQTKPTKPLLGTVYQTGSWDVTAADSPDTFYAKVSQIHSYPWLHGADKYTSLQSITAGSSTTSTLNYSNWVKWMMANGGSGSTSLGWWVQIDSEFSLSRIQGQRLTFSPPAVYGGAISQVSSTSTAYMNRNDVLNFQFYGSSGSNSFPSNGMTWMNSLVSSLQSNVVHACKSQYLSSFESCLTDG